jgi:phosphatidylserine/phosphatidylglycerophosphate/cardiolipin synthase-like enzyme
VTQRFAGLGPQELERLAVALTSGRLSVGAGPVEIGRVVAREHVGATQAGLAELNRQGFGARQAGAVLEALASERRVQREMSDRVELVWTSPEDLPSAARETSVVVRSLCQAARRRVLLANFAFDRPRSKDEAAKERARWLWRPLAENMDGNPELEVTLIAEIARKQDDERDEADLVAAFVDNFRRNLWPGERLPTIYYDERSARPWAQTREHSCMHAKCIVVDDEQVFVTSANFSSVAQERNIEVGVVVREARLAGQLRGEFERLLAAGVLRVAE